MAGGHQGNIKDPEHDGRLKENREEGRTKGATHGSHEPQEAGGHSSGERQHAVDGSRGHKGGGGQESRDLKIREYRDEQANLPHHPETYQQQHHGDR
jgi:hypothetical protein